MAHSMAKPKKNSTLPTDHCAAPPESRMGSDFVYPDGDQEIRRHLPVDPKNDMISSEGWTAAAFLECRGHQKCTNKYRPFYIDYYGRSGTIQGFSFSDVLAGSKQIQQISSGIKWSLWERALLPSTTVKERTNTHPLFLIYPRMPHSKAEWKVQTTGVSEHPPQRTPLPSPRRGGSAFYRPVRGVRRFWSGLIAASGGQHNGPPARDLHRCHHYFMFINHHTWFTWEIIVLAQLPLAWVFSASINSVQLYVEKQKVEQSLALYLSPKLVKQFAKDPTLLKRARKNNC